VPIRVVVNGALGRVGQEVVKAVLADPELRLVGATEHTVSQPYLPAPDYPELIPFSSNLGPLLEKTRPDVIVDFTRSAVAMEAARIALPLKVNMVIGTTGLMEADVNEIRDLAERNSVSAVVAPNFTIGAVLLMHLSKIACRFFDNVEIIEMHHDKKLDAPSGTAMNTARLMAEERGEDFVYPPTEKEVLECARGGQYHGIAVHSVRMPGIMASQEVIFGTKGQTLALRHDATSRESYMPGVILAVKQCAKGCGFVLGLDKLMGL
jgi:4-hydroxy-tetrahydrodipicolinate reductase